MSEVPRLPHRVTVVGGGFGGLYAARSLGIEQPEPPVLAPIEPGDLPGSGSGSEAPSGQTPSSHIETG